MNIENTMEEIITDDAKEILTASLSANNIELSEAEKIEKIAFHFAEIMQTLGLDLSDSSLRGTPMRVAKMYVQEIFSGLNPENKPPVSLFENRYHYQRMLVEKDITLYSNCEHHFVPIIGKAHVAYIPRHEVIGLSKINRLVQYYARRPQVQERLTIQIATAMKDALRHDDVAVLIEADHMCVAARGIKDSNSRTITSGYFGRFEDPVLQQEFLSYIYHQK